MKKHNLSPISITQNFLTEKIYGKNVRIWHYLVLLSIIWFVPFLINPLLSSEISLLVWSVVVLVSWMASRVVGQEISRTSKIDTILIYRFFVVAAAFGASLSAIVQIVLNNYSALVMASFWLTLWIYGTVFIVSIVGIIVHLKKNSQMIKNIPKKDLFQ